MKRVCLMLLCLALMISLCPVSLAATTISRDEPARQHYLYVIPDFYVPALYACLTDSYGNALTPWSGAMMARLGGVYELELPPDTSTINIHTNNNAFRSGDISIVPNSDVWIFLSYGNVQVVYEQPEDLPQSPAPELTVYRVTGNDAILGSWYPDNDGCIMERVEKQVYSLTLPAVHPGNYEFVISKNGGYDDSVWNNNDYFRFTATETTYVTITLTLSDTGASVRIAGSGLTNVEDSRPTAGANGTHGNVVVVKPTEPAVIPTEPVTVPTEPVIIPTEPVTIPTEPVTVPTEPVTVPTESVTVPTEPVTVPTEPVSVPTEPTVTLTEPTEEPTEPTVSLTSPGSHEPPADADSADAPVSPLVNLPIYSLNLFFIGIICVLLYLLLLLRRRKKERSAMILGGTVVTPGALSVKATEQLVKDNPVQPPAELDDAILSAIQKLPKNS